MDAGPPATRARRPHHEPPAVAAGGPGELAPSNGHASGNGHSNGHLNGHHVDASGNGHSNGAGRRHGHHKALVLNATMEPLCVVPARRAIVLVLNDKADVIKTNGHRYRSAQMDIQAPSVVRLRRFVNVPYRRRAALSRRGVFIRDEYICQYCGRPAENVDHVIPRSRGGGHEWENVVAACRRCNSKKKDLTPAESGMHLRRMPFAPRATFWLVVAVGGWQEDWHDYLGDALHTA